MTLFKFIRILILLGVFVAVAFYAKNQKLKSRSWAEPLEVVIYPINADSNSPVVNEYINDLDASVFEPVDRFLQQQSEKYKLIATQPTHIRMGPVLTVLPPEAPLPGDGYAAIIWWGLKFRYWTYKNTPDSDSNMRLIRFFVLYHEAKEGRRLQHSLGLDKGLTALVHAFASIDQDQQNNIVIAHEFLHTVGATDKYDADNNALFPIGYADPEQSPLYPQAKAEIMVGRVPLSATNGRMAASLDECVIGGQTAKEINWLQESSL
jgi:hypothetical protein